MRWICSVLIGFVLLPSTGCVLPGRRGPASKSLLESRQLSLRAASALERGDAPAAEKLLAKAVETCDTDPEARRLYADCLARRGATSDALAQLDEAIILSSEDPMLLVRRGEIHLSQGRVGGAMRSVESAINLDPRYAPAWLLRARARAHAGRSREALADYHRALGLQPGNRDTLLEIAQLHWRIAGQRPDQQAGQLQRALVTLQALEDTYPQGEEPQKALYLSGLVYDRLNRPQDAVRSLTAARLRGQDHPELLVALALAQFHAGRAREAMATVEQSLLLQPQHAASRRLRETIRVAMNRGQLR